MTINEKSEELVEKEIILIRFKNSDLSKYISSCFDKDATKPLKDPDLKTK